MQQYIPNTSTPTMDSQFIRTTHEDTVAIHHSEGSAQHELASALTVACASHQGFYYPSGCEDLVRHGLHLYIVLDAELYWEDGWASCGDSCLLQQGAARACPAMHHDLGQGSGCISLTVQSSFSVSIVRTPKHRTLTTTSYIVLCPATQEPGREDKASSLLSTPYQCIHTPHGPRLKRCLFFLIPSRALRGPGYAVGM